MPEQLTTEQPLTREQQLGRLRWRCRRGMQELDLLLLRFLDREGSRFSAVEIDQFEQFLSLPDPELAAMLLSDVQPQSQDSPWRDRIRQTAAVAS